MSDLINFAKITEIERRLDPKITVEQVLTLSLKDIKKLMKKWEAKNETKKEDE